MLLVFIVLVFVDCSVWCLSTQISRLFIELTFLSAMYVKAEHGTKRQLFNQRYCQEPFVQISSHIMATVNYTVFMRMSTVLVKNAYLVATSLSLSVFS